MPPPVAALLEAWDHAAELPPGRRALALLAAVSADEREPAPPTIGETDRRLLDLRESLFGPRLAALARCPRCSETLECELAVPDLREPPSTAPARLDPERLVRLEIEECRIVCRLPAPPDLDAIAGLPASEAPLALLERILVEAVRGETPLPPSRWSRTMLAAVDDALQAADPQASIRLDLACPACAHAWNEPFDPGAYLWTELDAWAQGTLREVDALARGYGWTEPEILALSPRRRRHYLGLLAS